MRHNTRNERSKGKKLLFWGILGTVLICSAGIIYAAVSFNTNVASVVFGQAGFTSNGAHTDAFGMDHPRDLFVHTTIRTANQTLADNGIFVADEGNNRILLFYSPVGSDTEADQIYGQPSESASSPGTDINRFDSPASVVAYNASDSYPGSPDTGGVIPNTLRTRVWVSDAGNHRIIRIDDPQINSGNAVYGQADFTSGLANRGGAVAANTLNNPQGLFVLKGDATGETDVDLIVADAGNNRVLYYRDCLNDGTADVALGQANLTSNGINRVAGAGNPANNTLHNPTDVYVDQLGRIYICDRGNHRVVRDDDFNGTWDYVYGPPDMDTFVTGTNRDYLHFPSRIELEGALTNEDDVLYVADEGNHRVVIYGNVANTEADTIIGQPTLFSYTDSGTGLSDTALTNPTAVERQGSLLYVVDMNNNRILGFPLYSSVTGGTAATASSVRLHANPGYLLYDNSGDVQETTTLTATTVDSTGATVTYNGTGTISCTGVGGTASASPTALTFTNGVASTTLTITRGLGVTTFSATLGVTLNGGATGDTTLVLTEDSSVVPVPSPSPTTSTLDGDRLCFIATAAYGAEGNDWQLRAFHSLRDDLLLENRFGRGLVSLYYDHSPAAAAWIAERPAARTGARTILTPLALAVEFPLAALAFFFIFLTGGLFLLSRKDRN